MQTFTILFSFLGFLSAGPQYYYDHYYRPSTFSLKPFVHFGGGYGGYQGGYAMLPNLEEDMEGTRVDMLPNLRANSSDSECGVRYYVLRVEKFIENWPP